VEGIATLPMVKRTAPEITGRVQVTFSDKNWNTQVTGTSPNYADMKSDQPIYGRFFSDDDLKKRNRVAILGLTVIKNIFGDNANPVGQVIKINRVNFQVIGVLPVKGYNGYFDQDDQILVPVTTAMYRLFGKLYVNQEDIEADNSDDTSPLATSVFDYMMHAMHIPNTPDNANAFNVRNMADIQAVRNQAAETFSILLTAIGAISLLVGGIGIMNIMLVSVTERTREIGLRKALGARSVDILSQFLIEAVVVSLIGGILGIGLGWVFAEAIEIWKNMPTLITPMAILVSTVFSALVGLVFGLWPAHKASQLSPILALRYE
jgi:macrolide transport system ATP-binding/permease protein